MDLCWESLNFSNAQILKKKCNFTLSWLLDFGNTSLEQNLRLKTVKNKKQNLRLIVCSLSLIVCFFSCFTAPWLIFGSYSGNSLTHLMSLTLHLGYQCLVQRWLRGIGSLLLIECPVGFDHNEITHLPNHPKLQKKLSQDLHLVCPKCGNANQYPEQL